MGSSCDQCGVQSVAKVGLPQRAYKTILETPRIRGSVNLPKDQPGLDRVRERKTERQPRERQTNRYGVTDRLIERDVGCVVSE